MNNTDANDLILSHVKENLDIILLVSGVLSILSSLAIYNSSVPFIFFIMDLVIGVVFMLLFTFRNRIGSNVKIIAITSIGVLIGGMSFGAGGFASAGLTILMMVNVLGVLMMPKRMSIAGSTVTFSMFLIFGVLNLVGITDYAYALEVAEWLVHCFMYLLYLVFIHLSVYAVRDHLVRYINAMEENARKTYQLAYYDQITGLPNYEYFKNLMTKN